MARINLLPWREELRKQYLKDFLGTIGLAVVLTLAVMLGVHAYIEGMKEHQKGRNKMISTEISKLNIVIAEIKDIESKKNKMLSKIETIYGLQRSRPQAVHLFEELTTTLPEGVYLTKFTQANKSLTVHGHSQSNARVSAYMRGIEASDWLKSPHLDVIQGGAKGVAGKEGHKDQFTLRAKLGMPKKVTGDKS